MRYIILVCFIICLFIQEMTIRELNRGMKMVLAFEQSILTEGMPTTFKFKGTKYSMYGMTGQGKIMESYDVYSPVFMADSAKDMLLDEVHGSGQDPVEHIFAIRNRDLGHRK